MIEVEVYGIPPQLYETIKSRPYVDSIAINTQDQKQLLLIHSLNGAEVVPQLMADLNEIRVGKVLVREPTLEDAYVRLVGGEVGGEAMSLDELRRNGRAILAVAEMTFRSNVMDPFIIFTIIVQPLIIALLGLWMLDPPAARKSPSSSSSAAA